MRILLVSRQAIYYYYFQADIKIQGGYGSSKDISVYQSIGLESQQIFINGKLSKKLQKEAVVRTYICYYGTVPVKFLQP